MANKKKSAPEALFIPAGLFIGIGVGFLVSNIPAATLIGFGTGFVLFAVFSLLKKKR